MTALFGMAVLCGVLGIVVDEMIRSWDEKSSAEIERRRAEREEALDRYWADLRRRREAGKANGGRRHRGSVADTKSNARSGDGGTGTGDIPAPATFPKAGED